MSSAAAAVAGPAERLANARWFSYPLGNAPRGTCEDYLSRAAEARAREYPDVDAVERRLGFAVDPEWLHELALHTQVTIKGSAICYQHGRLLYAAVRDYVRRMSPASVTILETGTARGFSALCMARALADAGVPGTILTHDVLPHEVPMFWNCIDDLDGPRSRAALLRPWEELVERYLVFNQGDTLRELPKLRIPRVNLAFLDGQHTYEYVIREFAQLEGRQRPGDVVFFDDYTGAAFPGVVRAVDEICERHGYDRQVVAPAPERGYVIAVKR